jgi:hypothetical protein
MEQSAYIMETITGAIFLVVGVRLYALSRQSDHAPERYIALTFLLWALGYALYDVPYAFAESDGSIAPAFSYTSMLALSLGNVSFAFFAKEVFRKQQRWASWLVAAIAICLLLGAAGSAWVGDWEQVDPHSNPGYWPQTLGAVAPALWMGAEGLVQYANTRKRRKIGLCSPLICHNFLLWGLAGVLWAGLEIVIVVQDIVYLSAGDWSGALGVVNGLLEIVPIGMIWLVFFAPPRYRRWIERAAPT